VPGDLHVAAAGDELAEVVVRVAEIAGMIRALVVDDDGSARTLLRGSLERTGLEVFEASDGQVAIAPSNDQFYYKLIDVLGG